MTDERLDYYRNLCKPSGLGDPAHPETMHASEGRELIGEIDRLRAIVDKLPKTADGVPITPGMDVWEVIPGTGVICYWCGVRIIDEVGIVAENGSSTRTTPDRCYSTEAAAIEAQKEQDDD